MARKKNTRTDNILDIVRGGRGVERQQELSKGGQQAVIYRGGKASVTVDRRKENNRKACRGRVRW